MMVFISYRRSQTQHITDRIYDRLAAELGRESVYKDVTAIPLGRDFREEIRHAVGRCDALLVVLGPEWVSAAGPDGAPRLQDPNDYVRTEIEAALERDVPVIPLLVDGATVPRAGLLPQSIQSLAYRNGMPVRPDPDFDNDVGRLLGALRGHRPRGWRPLRWLVLAAAAVLFTVALPALVRFFPRGDDRVAPPRGDDRVAPPRGDDRVAPRRGCDFANMDIPLHAAQVRSETRRERWKHCLWLGLRKACADEVALVTYRFPQFSRVVVPFKNYGLPERGGLEGNYKFSADPSTRFRASYFGNGYLEGNVSIVLYARDGTILILKSFEATMSRFYENYARESDIDNFLTDDGSVHD
jgi:hypothetical protein